MIVVWLVLVAAVVTAATPDLAHAASAPTIAPDFPTVLSHIRDWLMGILTGLATVCLSVGFVRRIVGAGDPEEQGKAKEAFKAAALGYAGAALAPLIVTVLQGIVGA